MHALRLKVRGKTQIVKNRSRFLRLTLHEYRPQEFREFAVKTLTKREGLDHHLAEYIAKKLMFETIDR